MFSKADTQYMAHALRLGRRGLLTATPNPRVGCVLVNKNAIVGEGWHERAGTPHAEIVALNAAKDQAAGATAYVTLEPCCHFGRTAPCADALIAAGISRVVAAMQDPNPRVAGAGFERLKAAQVQVESGLLETQARDLNMGFVSRMTRGRPWVTMKIASSLDGKTALATGESRWLTSENSRRDAHRFRARACAILTGIGTVVQDDPEMTVRHVDSTRRPLRVVVDSKLQIPNHSKILAGGGTLVASALNYPGVIRRLQNAGAQVVVIPGGAGKVDLNALMRELGNREINEVLVEAGSGLNGALLRAGLVDELLLYMSPHLLGEAGRGMFDLSDLPDLERKREFKIVDVRKVGTDMRILARL
ncbi:MAG: bifunctional diaminohydroxyphosphoribosylaminopyrimidine deaminase/5-amino-6-(5-phosphoribosylamino)uracil reductase RibD [Burkholderiales bacterium]